MTMKDLVNIIRSKVKKSVITRYIKSSTNKLKEYPTLEREFEETKERK